jgi:hypothetical protein
MKKLILLIAGLSLPWTAFGDVQFYDRYGMPTGSAQEDGNGGWYFYDKYGMPTGNAQSDYNGGWTFYDRFGMPVGNADGE